MQQDQVVKPVAAWYLAWIRSATSGDLLYQHITFVIIYQRNEMYFILEASQGVGSPWFMDVLRVFSVTRTFTVTKGSAQH